VEKNSNNGGNQSGTNKNTTNTPPPVPATAPPPPVPATSPPPPVTATAPPPPVPANASPPVPKKAEDVKGKSEGIKLAHSTTNDSCVGLNSCNDDRDLVACISQMGIHLCFYHWFVCEFMLIFVISFREVSYAGKL
jgi:hypothetical protein